MNHLLMQCYFDYDMIFLLNEAPTDNRLCPVCDCQVDLQKCVLKLTVFLKSIAQNCRVEARKRSLHVHDCACRDIA